MNQLSSNENNLNDPKSGVFGSDFYPGVNRVRNENNLGQKGITETRLFFRLRGLDSIFWSIDTKYPLDKFDWLNFIPGYKDGQNPSDSNVINSLANYFNVNLNRKDFDNLKLFLNTAPGTTQADGTVSGSPRPFSELLINSRTTGAAGDKARKELRGITRESIKLILTTPQYVLL
ncbi:MAG: hypothetical protein KBC84_10775, partial [Proteobacteria bacterium]|nr:hypothetical protein [Pseudomonadota bacterium]